jgi:2-phospho-L-lactate guanylyltransferase
MTIDWTIVIPIKHTDDGKSRLAVPGVSRTALARAIALDTIAAAIGSAQVVVVTSDGSVAEPAQALGARVVRDPGDGLDSAVAAGMAESGFRAAMLGDLPALRTADLALALNEAASTPRIVVADVEGTGSTLLTAGPRMTWASSFGAGSLERHVTLGCVRSAVPETSTLRRDVDTAAQLWDAAQLELGPRTIAVLRDAACGDLPMPTHGARDRVRARHAPPYASQTLASSSAGGVEPVAAAVPGMPGHG